MSFDSFLNQTCSITRQVASGVNAYNNATTSPTAVASDVRCRKTQRTMRIIDPQTAEYAFVRVDLVLLPPGTDVQPEDVITIGSQAWTAQQPLKRQAARAEHHVSVIVEAVNA
jgi:hypothetical protein